MDKLHELEERRALLETKVGRYANRIVELMDTIDRDGDNGELLAQLENERELWTAAHDRLAQLKAEWIAEWKRRG